MMKRFTKHASIRFKIFLIITGSIVCAFLLFAIIVLRHQKQIYTEDLLFNAQAVSETVVRSLAQDMMANDTHSISLTLASIGEQETLENLRIYTHQGNVWASSNREEVGKLQFTRTDSRQCTECHPTDSGPGQLERKFVTYNMDSNDAGLVNAIIPILNRPSCSTADCHFHDSSNRILGFLNMSVGKQRVENSLRDSQLLIMLISLVFVLLVPGLIMVFMKRYVVQPLHRLVEGTNRVSRGELDVVLPVTTEDEIGKLAASFNDMVEKLQQFQTELQGWNRELEQRVQHKTEKLKVAQGQIIQAEKMSSLGRLSAVIAHEINNPISGLVVFIHLLQKQLDKETLSDEDRLRMLKRLALMESEAKRCGQIVSELLAFSREEKKMIPSDIGEIIRRTVSIMELRVKDRELVVLPDVEEGLPKIECDPGKIQQVLMNLIQNGIEAIPDGGEVRVRARYLKESNQVEIQISDTGIGIPESHLAHIFEPFYSSKDQGQSVGIGLFVVYGVVEQHNGTIDVVSREGQGTTFIIKLPVSM